MPRPGSVALSTIGAGYRIQPASLAVQAIAAALARIADVDLQVHWAILDRDLLQAATWACQGRRLAWRLADSADVGDSAALR